ncbi:MAG TPA: phosphoribosylglycinamide formyltransferase [Dysgonamonadaceae bacterium]|nr:phosphoribosylglycinamide formyltransferase [Dysgonamonadaceae bacterium]
MTEIALFASGNGTNVENIAKYFAKSRHIKVSLVVSNKPNAYVHRRAKALKIPSYSFSNEQFIEGNRILTLLLEHKIDFIVLAGFLLKVPNLLLEKYPNKIINIHPALLPKHGGKGMYGDRVHKKVIKTGDTKSGITIHYVNDKYDDGEIIFQQSCDLHQNDTYEDVAEKVHKLEYEYFPRIIEEVILGKR